MGGCAQWEGARAAGQLGGEGSAARQQRQQHQRTATGDRRIWAASCHRSSIGTCRRRQTLCRQRLMQQGEQAALNEAAMEQRPAGGENEVDGRYAASKRGATAGQAGGIHQKGAGAAADAGMGVGLRVGGGHGRK